jgi:EAL domain-containing protein (putative c-di-GMP-specific phosphodiesterase class I)/AmiR/NasT family two-component response regulator
MQLAGESAGRVLRATRILVVDDDESVGRAYALTLRHAGHWVDLADSGEAALRRLDQGQPLDAVLLDIHLPGISGLEFLKVLRSRDDAVSVILITGDPALQTAVHAVEQGAYRYLVKPLHPDDLCRAVEGAAMATGAARMRNDALAIVTADIEARDQRALLDMRFDRALDEMWMAYQQVVDLTSGSVIGHEAYVRSREPELSEPSLLFRASEELGRTHEVGRRVREMVAHQASSFADHQLLFVNLHSAELLDLDLIREDSPLAAVASRVVLEITERQALGGGLRDLEQRVGRLRDMGFRIAVDDLGAGYSGLTTLSQLYPDYAKIDVSLVRGIDSSLLKRSVVRSLLSVCAKELNMFVIAEGVETEAEKDCLINLGCTLMQGFYFARPSEQPPPL